MRTKIFTVFLLAGIMLTGCSKRTNTFFEKKLTFPNIITSDQKVKLAAHIVPTPRQYAWQQLELTAFIHFGMNTFTGREWGDGRENPTLFNPTDFNAEQWVSTLNEAGFKMLILTAKHHDGFCLWPSKTTAHTVAASRWRDGQGDVVREVKNACDKFGMKFGVYLSPWDRNAESYGDSPRYNAMFVEQLKELLTNYGEVHEVWFDGANAEGPNGRRQEYDWARFYHVIDSLQPDAVKAIMGDDVRWVGNERGLGRETEWSVTPLNPDINEAVIAENKRLQISPTAQDLGSRKLVEQSATLYWYPSEVDVSIRPGWFYHPEEDHRVKTLQQLVDIYYQSVGMNSVLLLNIPPDTRGLLHEIDAERLKQFGGYIKNTFADNRLVDGVPEWKARQGDSREFIVSSGQAVNTVMIQEDIRRGQRVEVFEIDGLVGGEWVKLAEGTTIGYKRLLKFDDVAPDKIRITIVQTRDAANIKAVGAYYAPRIDGGEAAAVRLSDIAPHLWKATAISPLVIDLGQNVSVKGFTYSPDAGRESVFAYAFGISDDGVLWHEIKRGEFSNVKNNPIPQRISFDESVTARFIRFETISGTDGGKPVADMKQIGILTK